jgi:thiamine biosynthesis lipoprotein
MPDGVEAGILAVLASVIAQMSNWEPESDISRFNRSVLGEWQPMPEDFLKVLRAGLRVAKGSGGAFDPAIGAMVEAWGFGPAGRRSSPPAAGQGWRAISLDGDCVRRDAPVTLDLSGIAKGFAVDAVADRLLALGLQNFLIEIGGELRGEGVKPDGQPWWVDVEVPPGLSAPVTRIALCGLAIATSGDYRRWFEEDGIRYAHSLDPRTGIPVANGVASVTVFHPSTMYADAWATALLVLGPQEGLSLAARNGLAAMMITRGLSGAKEWMSPAFNSMLG